MFWLIPAASAFLALVLIGVGAVAALRAASELQRGAKRVQTPRAWMDPERPAAAAARLAADGEAMGVVAGRCAAAVRQIRAGLIELRLPHAVAALRLTAVAVRALTHGR